ncbi:MAG: hypothetical protein JNJ54_00395 [Myxococcaceae bacterium]|nr:hypothetical protein [Myxococcaceae bacterium]
MFHGLSSPFVTWAGTGWLVAGGKQSYLVGKGGATMLATDGVVTAACFDGERTWLALAKAKARAHELVASSIAVLEGERVVPWRSLDVLGAAARAVPWLAAVDGEVVLSSSLEKEPRGHGWALHRLGATGGLRASLELQPASYCGSVSQVGRLGRRIFVGRLAIGLDLVTAERPGPDPASPMAWGAREASLRVSWDEAFRNSTVRVVVETGGGPTVEHPAAHAPNMLAVGASWVAWGDARRCALAHDEGAPGSLRLSSVRQLASSGVQLAALVMKSPGVELVTLTP